MEMPESCYTCKLGRLWDDGSHDCRISKGLWMEDYPYTKDVRHAECPLRPLPEKHGGLIDADKFDVYVETLWRRNEITNGDWFFFREWMRKRETVVEAEGKS